MEEHSNRAANAETISSETQVTLTEKSPSEQWEAFAFSHHPGGNTGDTRVQRFNASLLVLLSIAFVSIILHSLLSSTPLFSLFIVPLTLFIFEWNNVHAPALSRIKRAFFDVANVLETYQPRARTMGHLFQPDPPTPAPAVSFAGLEENSHETPETKNAFTNARDQHYAGMYQEALKLAREMEAMDKGKGSVMNDAAPVGKELVPANVEEDQKRAEEEKKETQRQREQKMKEDADKPFRC